jgi:hypothetical protein
VVVGKGEGLGSEQILRECRGKLSAFQIPQRLEVVAGLPHTAKGALDRRTVEDQYAIDAASAGCQTGQASAATPHPEQTVLSSCLCVSEQSPSPLTAISAPC